MAGVLKLAQNSRDRGSQDEEMSVMTPTTAVEICGRVVYVWAVYSVNPLASVTFLLETMLLFCYSYIR